MEKTDPDYNKLIKLTNGKLLRNGQFIKDDLWIRNGKIINPETVFFDEKVRAYRTINLKNCFIAPGYIDLQINGGWGVDFSSNISTVEEGITKVAQKLVEHGVTSFCPTLVTSPAETYHTILKRIPTNTINNGAGVLGVHLEGPFINPEKKGAHPIEYIRTLEKGYDTVLEAYGSLDNVKIVTLAPEIDVKGDAIYMLKKKDITVSLGHSMGSLKDGERGVRRGASLITHLFNAMLPFHHRDPGLVGLLASDDIPKDRTVYFSIIADGVHTHPAALRIAHRIHPNGLCLVTDAISALGLEEGIHQIGQLKVEVRNDKAFVAGTDTLCGSITPLDECVRIFKKVTGCTIAQAIEAATLHPARCLNIEKSKGTLDFDTDADFIITEGDLCILSTWIAGKPVYDRCCWETTENDVRIWPPSDCNC